MFRTAIIATATILAAALTTQAGAQSGVPAHKLAAPAAGQWAVASVGEQTVSYCEMGLRSDAAGPSTGAPQFMITADDQFVMLRVRAAEWSFSASRDIAVTLATENGAQRQPAAAVHGADLVDIAFGVEPERMTELAGAGYLDIRAEGATVRLPLKGLAEVLPAYRDCLASIGQPSGRSRLASAALAAR